jgi:Protein of unknown function (DUF4197)/Peptidase family M48/DnaJ-like protein C11, C-terminal
MQSKGRLQSSLLRTIWYTVITALVAIAIAFALTVVLSQSTQAQTLTIIHNFTGGADEAYSSAGLRMEAAGNFYETTHGSAGYAGAGSSRLTINRAQYGAAGRFTDVTARLNSQIQGDQLSLQVTNDTMGGDPAYGQNKTLTVQYTYNGRTGQVSVKEGDYLRLPDHTATYQSSLQILRAEYGAGSRSSDVTARLNSQIQDDQLSLPVTNDTMGGDPAQGHAKTLTVRYSYKGAAGQVAVNEGDYLRLPGENTPSSPQQVSEASSPQLPNPGDTGVSKEQQEQLGLQAAAEVYKQVPVLPDSGPATQYVQQLGRKLVSVIPQQESWPYQFHVVAQKEINAFALPGGPIFINLGTITAADNEAELAGVMAHEMSHVYMQHSIKQMKTQQTEQELAGILGAVLGQVGGVAGSLGQLGVNLGAGMLSLKYSRSDEAQADAVGAVIMYQAGYEPKALAEFFQKLEQQGGGNGPGFLSDHPDPGNRVAAVEKEIQGWPPRTFEASSQAFVRARQQAQTVRAYSAQEIAQGAKDGTWARQNLQSGSTLPNLPAPANPPGVTLSNDQIAGGLKEALTLSTGTAVASTGRPDGYFKNPAIKILLPSSLQTVAKGMRMLGMSAQLDDLELSMNRAAEQAAPAAKQVFINSIRKMSFADVRQILFGGNTAATDYFKKTSSTELAQAFTPIVHQSMENVGVIKQFNDLAQNSMAAPLLADQNFNLDGYVVGKALDGLFYMLGQEEKQIRTDPAARTTALLKEVFGKK